VVLVRSCGCSFWEFDVGIRKVANRKIGGIIDTIVIDSLAKIHWLD